MVVPGMVHAPGEEQHQGPSTATKRLARRTRNEEADIERQIKEIEHLREERRKTFKDGAGAKPADRSSISQTTNATLQRPKQRSYISQFDDGTKSNRRPSVAEAVSGGSDAPDRNNEHEEAEAHAQASPGSGVEQVRPSRVHPADLPSSDRSSELGQRRKLHHFHLPKLRIRDFGDSDQSVTPTPIITTRRGGGIPMSRTISFKDGEAPPSSRFRSTSAFGPFSARRRVADADHRSGDEPPLSSASGYYGRGGSLRRFTSADTVSTYATDTTDGESSFDDEPPSHTGRIFGLFERLRAKRRRLHEEDERQVALAAELALAQEQGTAIPAHLLDQSKIRLYRKTPILSGTFAPFAIMLEVPGFTSKWYVRTPEPGVEVVYQDNPVILDVGLAISMALAVLANVFIILRFLEFVRPRSSTLVAIVSLTIHDIINITAIAIFGVIHSVDDGFTYSESFYMTIASTVASVLVNITLVLDFWTTKNFRNAGSGLTQKQKELVIITMIFLVYLSLGSLLYSLLLGLSFENALYFVLASLLTVGFGDFTPTTVASRIILFFYAPAGIVLVALTIATARQTILESFEKTYKRRRAEFQHRYEEKQRARREHRQERKKARRTWSERRAARKERKMLERTNTMDTTASSRWRKTLRSPSMVTQRTLMMFRSPLSARQPPRRRDAIEVDVGVGDDTVTTDDRSAEKAVSSTENTEESTEKSLIAESHDSVRESPGGEKFKAEPKTADAEEPKMPMSDSPVDLTLDISGLPRSDSPQAEMIPPIPEMEHDGDQPEVPHEAPDDAADSSGDDLDRMEDELRKQREMLEQDWKSYKALIAKTEKAEFYVKLGVALSLFFFFWLMGSLVFTYTEGFNYFQAFYFCWVAISTIGYGDLTPTTPAGRAFFIIWALFGIGILTIVFAVVGDAWGSIYQKTLRRANKKRAVAASHARQRALQRASEKEKTRATHDSENLSPDPPATPSEGQDLEVRAASKHGEPMNGMLQALPTKLREFFNEHGHGHSPSASSSKAPSSSLPPQELEDILLHLVKSLMTMHEHATQFIMAHRPIINESMSKLPDLQDVIVGHPDHLSPEQLDECLHIAESMGDLGPISAVKQLKSFKILERDVEVAVRFSHRMKDALASQRHEIETLRKRLERKDDEEEDEEGDDERDEEGNDSRWGRSEEAD